MMKKSQQPSVITLIALTAFAAVAAVLYTPALPRIMRDFGVSTSAGQMTMTVFLIAYTLGQLFFGPITNRFGRKPTIYFGISIGIIGSLLCSIAPVLSNFDLFVWGRGIQGLGTSVGLVLAFSIINDRYEGAEARKIIAYSTLAFAVLPGVSIFIGGLLVKYFSWVSCFYFLIAYSFFVLALVTKLPETSTETDINALKISQIILRYQKVIRSRRLIAYASLWGLSTAIVYIFATIAPILTIKYLHATPAVYGLLNLLTSAGLVSGNLFSANITKKLSGQNTILLGILLAATGSASLMLLKYFASITLVTFYVPIFFLYSGLPLIFANASALASENVNDKATAASMVTLTNMTIAVIGLMIVSASSDKIIFLMPEIFSGIVITMVILLAFIQRMSGSVS